MLVSLMMSGSTDDAIANQLGINVRSVRRWIAELMDELGVTTRLQLGAALVRANGCAPRAEPGPTPGRCRRTARGRSASVDDPGHDSRAPAEADALRRGGACGGRERPPGRCAQMPREAVDGQDGGVGGRAEEDERRGGAGDERW